jgi:hypothetical protein
MANTTFSGPVRSELELSPPLSTLHLMDLSI